VLKDGEPSGAAVSRAMRAAVAAEPLVQLDYAVVVDAHTLEEVADLTATARSRSACSSRPGGSRAADRQQRRPDDRR